ncbi:nacht domain protein [Rutstroemia sp. NJR-2017a WRK4]|nr:nacht domain protein [Rutstroemia sp. NJR-2017a WRK4]
MATVEAQNGGGLQVSKFRQISNGAHLHRQTSESFQSMQSSMSDIRTINGSDHIQTTLLHDATQRALKQYRSELGQGSEKFLQSCTTVERFFDIVATIRLLQIPHRGSRWDKVLKWAEFFAGQVSAFAEEIATFTTPHEQKAATIIWASFKMGPKYVSVLEKVFGVFYNCGTTLGRFLRHHELIHSVEELQATLTTTYVELLKLVTGITLYYSRRHLDSFFSVRGFDELFGKSIDEFFFHSDRFVDKIWSLRLKQLAGPGDSLVEAVRDFLTPHDRVLRILAFNRRTHTSRVDFTCEWFDRHLTEFSRSGKSVFVVTGAAGVGKTILSEWVVERLESLKNRRATEVIRYTIDSDLKTELSSFSVVKGLLLQLLQLNAGDNSLYKQILHAYELYNRGSPVAEVEESLWIALEKGLRVDRSQTIVVDGIDQVSGGEAQGLAVLERLRAIVSKHPNTKCIVFSRPFTKPTAAEYFHFSIAPEHTAYDIQYFTNSLISSSKVLDQKDLASITPKLVELANGSFVWVQYAIEILRLEQSSEAVLKRLETLPKALAALLDIIVSSLDLKDRDTKSLLAWLLASERPLLITEVKQLLEIDTASCHHVPRTGHTEDVILKAIGPLVDLNGGFVRFSHDLVKENIRQRALSVADFKNTGPFPFHLKEAHYDLATRAVAYAKITLSSRPAQSTFDALDEEDLDDLFKSHPFIQYASRYWIVHFAESPMNEASQHKITSSFKNCFPDSTLMALIEGACFKHHFSIHEALKRHQLAYSIRKTVLGASSESVLQTVINLAVLHQRILAANQVNEYYFEAWKLSTTLRISSLAFKCATRYIETTWSVTITSKTELALRRIEVLEYIIEEQKSTSTSSEEIIKFVETLVETYVAIGKKEETLKWRRYIYELNLIIYGESAPETLRSWELVSSTSTTTTTVTSTSVKQEYEISLRRLPVADSKRIGLAWAMIETYEKEKDVVRAEEVLITLWQSLTSLTHTYDVTIQEKKIEVALRYVEFLKRQQRITEAEIILRSAYADLEYSEIQSTTLIQHTRTVAEYFKSFGSVSAARVVFSRLWDYYVSTGKQETTEAKSISTSITEITQTTTEETKWDITTIRETFEKTIINKTTTTIDITTVHTSTKLCTSYYSEQKWSEVVKIATSTLTRLWSSFSSTNINLALPSNFTNETLELLNRLAFSYFKLRQVESAELIYRKIFYAVKASPASSDELIISTSRQLIEFYESNSMSSKIIIVYKDLHHEVERRHGKTHSWTIKTLYTLGDLSMKLYDINSAEVAYRTIHANLSKDNLDICHKDAMRAALALCNIYEQQRQYATAQKICSSLWHMLIKHGKEYDVKPDVAEQLYHRYVRITRVTPEPHYNALRQLAVDFHKACLASYGVHHEVTIKATLQLAEIDEDNEHYHEEAIAMYEDAGAKAHEAPKGHVSEATLSAVIAAKKRLPHLYSTSKLFASAKALTLYRQEFKKFQAEKGYSHRDTLHWLGHLTRALMKQGNTDSSNQAQHLLRSTVLEVLKQEKESQILADTAVTFANLYKRAGLESEARLLVRQLRTNAVFGSNGSKDKLETYTWVFLVSFEATVTDRKEFFSSIMADLLTEVFLYQSYQRSISQKASFATVLSYASRLLSFLRNTDDEAGYEIADRQILDYFKAYLNIKTPENDKVIREFMQIVLFNLSEDRSDVSVLQVGIEAAGVHLSHGKFMEARELAYYLDQFQQLSGGYDDLVKIDMGLRLATTLAHYKNGQAIDAKIRSSLLDMSGSIMKQIIQRFRGGQFHIVDMPINDLNNACGLLGEINDLENLEWLLSQLWSARHTQTSWSSSTVVHIGRLLVETQFSRKHIEEAIHLCEDMTYNVRRVWGSLDSTTIEMQILLSSFYTSSSQHAKAMRIHEELLRETIRDAGDELSDADACRIALKQIDFLKRTYQRLGKWDKDPSIYIDLFQRVSQKFEAEPAWKAAKLQSVDKWQIKAADELGVWHRPASFEFMDTTRVEAEQWVKTQYA